VKPPVDNVGDEAELGTNFPDERLMASKTWAVSSAEETARTVLDRYGTTYADEVGIPLGDAPAPLFSCSSSRSSSPPASGRASPSPRRKN
jgi:hypothetical protein